LNNLVLTLGVNSGRGGNGDGRCIRLLVLGTTKDGVCT